MHYQYKTPFGIITIREIDGAIANVALSAVSYDDDFAPSSLINACANEIIEYLFGKRTLFDIPLRKQDSLFKETVYEAVCDIPYGQTRTSKEIASMIGNADAYRAIGKALNENPLCILIPTHRVIRTSLTAKSGNDMTSALRNLESKFKTGN